MSAKFSVTMHVPIVTLSGVLQGYALSKYDDYPASNQPSQGS